MKIKAKLIEAKYVEEAQSVLLMVERDGEQQHTQIHRDSIATFGDRTEEDITKAMYEYVETLNKIYKGQEINLERAEK